MKERIFVVTMFLVALCFSPLFANGQGEGSATESGQKLDVLKYLVIVSSVAMMTYGYVAYIRELALTKSPALRIPNYLFFGAFPFGIFMIILVLIFKTKMILGIENPPKTSGPESSMGAV